jgi:hypothetical protein
MKAQRKDSALIFYPYEKVDDTMSYPTHLKDEMLGFVSQKIIEKVPTLAIEVN